MTKYKSEAELFDSAMAADIAEHMNLDLSNGRNYYTTSEANEYSAYVVVFHGDGTGWWYLD